MNVCLRHHGCCFALYISAQVVVQEEVRLNSLSDGEVRNKEAVKYLHYQLSRALITTSESCDSVLHCVYFCNK